MVTCTKCVLLDEVDGLATAYAEANSAVSLSVAREAARAIVEEAFGSLAWETATASLECWSHRSPADHERDWRKLLISRDCLIGAAESYVEKPWLRSRNLDWLFVNSLVYAEFLAYLDSVRTKRYGIFRVAAEKDGDKVALRWLLAARVGTFLVKWLAWLAVFVLALAINPIVAAFVAVATVAFKAWKLHERHRQNKLLQSMLQAYAPLRSPTLSWPVVWDELNVARRRGVVWDGVVYRLAELRMADCGNAHSATSLRAV